jgi:myo-inositol-hexaphosphate 3-phosphohydrolase
MNADMLNRGTEEQPIPPPSWQMSFNPDKCEVLRITNKRNKIMANYYIHGQQLQIVDNAKYLGLTISKNLS